MKSEYRTVTAIFLSILIALAWSATKADAAGSGSGKKTPTPEQAVKELKPGDGIYAVIDTNLGRIICKLSPDKAPVGVDNFVGLAEGTKEFTDPKTGQKTKRRFYDGLIFHRVIPGFMIQGGDPLGTGYGGPGYKFKNEVSKDLKFDRAGRLAYANTGPDTNGSQFFITTGAASWLDGGYTIFGSTIKGQDVVNQIGSVPRNQKDVPLQPVVMFKVSIVRISGK